MPLPIEVNEDRQEPIYYQIEEQVKALIVSGYLPADTALPSIRALASELGCSVITTRRAYQNLEQQAYIKTYRGKGTFVQEVGKKKRSMLKEQAVQDVLRQAVKTARQHEYTDTEIQRLLTIVLKEER
ncbi:GntR family transcriptional regulator [Natribacillus halophilus]|uniref:Transcriptional regulator, GntR family n=1 Tax=Natribacillus halophilus TaxID=549003 RepID=A0A1G8NKL5_9BACI|nr:GntR family transcriptional regulator [Natribacillus halophilus]SDI80718.1 transcriptional regulator, GntR family [Natribacillus halophilus]